MSNSHIHTYDAQGKQNCCTLEQKINKHTEHDGHDHSNASDNTIKMFLPAIISFLLLIIAIAIDNYFPQTWFTGSVRIAWYIIAYLPVGFPVLKEAIESISNGEIF